MSTNKNLNQAHIYRENGWNIFPLTPNEKTPFAKVLAGGSQNSTLSTPLTEADIETIWLQHPDANIGAHTGTPSQIVVVDIDIAKNQLEVEEGKRTTEQAEDLMEQLVATFGDTQVHKTPSGGYHLFYKYTPLCEGIGRKINAFKSIPNANAYSFDDESGIFDLTNIDVLAGNGYVVLPPSTTKGEGKKKLTYEVVSECDSSHFPDFPDELMRLLSKRNKVAKTYFEIQEGLQKPITQDNTNEKKLVTMWDMGGKQKLVKKLKMYMGTGSGSRHDALMKVCGMVFHALPYQEWDKAHEYVNMVISTFNPPYFSGSEDDVESDKREVRNAFNYAKAHEYVERVGKQEKAADKLNETIERDLGELKDIGTEVDEDEYKAQIERVYDAFQKDNQGNAIANDTNIDIILREHPKYKGRVRYDQFLEELTYLCKIGSSYRDHYLEDSKNNPAMARLVQDIQRDFFPKVPRVSVFSAAVSIGHDVDYDSYRAQMQKLVGKWDGKERMSLWLSKVFDLPDDLYHRGVSAQFVFAMVRRAYEPGAEFQKVLFLSGNQGTGKSYSMKILAGNDGYLEFNDEIAGREFNLHAKGKKVIDLAEGETMQRSSARRIKALISDDKGVHRTFGSAEVKDHPVRYVMSITNNDSPLVDNTGNRRFLVVKPKLKSNVVGDVVWLQAFRSQIFAEAVHKYHEMKKLETELAEEVVALEEADASEALYEALQKQNKLKLYEMKLSDKSLTPAQAQDVAHADTFTSPYGVALIPYEISESAQTKARMKSVVEEEIQAILNSYDEYRAGHGDFFISAQEIYNQISEEAIRQSRFGSFALAEASRLIPIVDERLDKVRRRTGDYGFARGYKFIHPAPDAKERLAAIRRLRSRADKLKPMPPSQFGGGSKAVTTDQKSAKIRWEREGDAYLIIKDQHIDQEVNAPQSVDEQELVHNDNF